MTLLRRIGPAVLLFFLAPIIAEFLLGDFSVRMLGLVLVLAPMYGGGALLIREIARRTGRGWPAMLLLATAYAVIEEAFTTQSLFNPNYAGARLLDYGFIPALGTSFNWTVFVLSIHVVWSVATPILIAEGIAGERRNAPWLKLPGLVITALLFLLGCAATTNYSLHASPFRASSTQLMVAAALAAVAIIAAFVIRPAAPMLPATAAVSAASASASSSSSSPSPSPSPSSASWPWPWLVGVIIFVFAMAFLYIESSGRSGRLNSPPASLLLEVSIEVIAAVRIVRWSRLRGWSPRHYLAIAAGTSMAYATFSLYAFAHGRTHLGAPTNAVDIIGQIILSAAVLSLIAWGARR